jgi:hypothetical protein
MAKKSAVENNKRKMRLVKQYLNRRNKLHPACRSAAQFVCGAHPQSLRRDRPPARQLSQDENVAHRVA